MTDVVDTPSEEEVEANGEKEFDWFSARGIKNRRIIAAIQSVPRDKFMDMEKNAAMPAQALPSLEIVGKLLEALSPQEGAKILEVGTDTGYISAVLSKLADKVYTVERRLPVAKLAEGRLTDLGMKNVEVLHGPRLTEYALNAPQPQLAPSKPLRCPSAVCYRGQNCGRDYGFLAGSLFPTRPKSRASPPCTGSLCCRW
ncbi:MAG: protein-L-isoaspartate O-methyltransferase family protein, partial [Bradymonadaceae bacterium]